LTRELLLSVPVGGNKLSDSVKSLGNKAQ
jgi:hypothetical protein